MARTLVTGGGGFAGLHLLRELCATSPDEITATYIGEPPAGHRLGPDLARVEWLPMDLTEQASVEDVVARARPERVYHLAGQASVGSSFGAPLATWEVNATGTMRLLEALRRGARRPVRILLVSSAEVYGAVPPDAQPIGEERGYAPLNPYGVSKAAAELAALQVGRAAGIEVVVARSFNHFGPGQDERFVMASMAKQLAALGAAAGDTSADVPAVRRGDAPGHPQTTPSTSSRGGPVTAPGDAPGSPPATSSGNVSPAVPGDASSDGLDGALGEGLAGDPGGIPGDPPGAAREIRVGNLEVERDFLDVRDVAHAYRVLMERGEAGGVYNVCSGRAVSLREVVERMVSASGTGARIVVDPARVRPADTPVLSGDNGRLRALGWAPAYTLEATLADLLRAAGAAPVEGRREGDGGAGRARRR